jgi:hypothetical protein
VLRFDATADREADLLAVDGSLDPQHRKVPPTMPRCDQSALRFTEGIGWGLFPLTEQWRGHT